MVDQIFARLSLEWGRNFLAQYEGQNLDIVRNLWAEKLAGLQARPYAIAYGIDNLPGKVMNAIEFRDLCRRAPEPAVARLKGPDVNQPLARSVLNAIRPAFRSAPDPLANARSLKARHEAGEKLNRAQIEFYQIALRHEEFQPIEPISLGELDEIVAAAKAQMEGRQA